MFAVACRSFVTATALENYEQNGEVDCGQALHAAAAAVCGNSINSRDDCDSHILVVIVIKSIFPHNCEFIFLPLSQEKINMWV